MFFVAQCGKMGLEDYVQLGGSLGLDSSKMAVVDEFCGQAALPSKLDSTNNPCRN